MRYVIVVAIASVIVSRVLSELISGIPVRQREAIAEIEDRMQDTRYRDLCLMKSIQ
jgi:hypothetical protein